MKETITISGLRFSLVFHESEFEWESTLISSLGLGSGDKFRYYETVDSLTFQRVKNGFFKDLTKEILIQTLKKRLVKALSKKVECSYG